MYIVMAKEEDLYRFEKYISVEEDEEYFRQEVIKWIKKGGLVSLYTGGFTMIVKKDLTKFEYIRICEEVSKNLNNLYELKNEIKVVPEPISEGGFLIIDSRDTKKYKSIRHRFREVTWPKITSSSYEEWISNDEDILIPANSRSDTIFKSSKGTPIWTLAEMYIFIKALEKYEIEVRNIPKKLPE
jgi:hypothetical protein